MKPETYEKERLRGVHLTILSVLTLAAGGVTAVAILCEWPEQWMLPFLLGGTLACWAVYILQPLTEDQRLWLYAIVCWAVIVFDGVHTTSLFDISVVTAVEFALFSQTQKRSLLHIGLALYFFLCAYQVVQIIAGNSVELNSLTISQMALHFVIVLIVYWLGLRAILWRREDRRIDEHVIADLQETQKHTEDFLANVSHELRTPINAVLGIGSVLMQEATDEKGREHATNVFRAGRRLSEQIDDILEYTEIDTDKMLISEEPYMISSVVNDVIVSLSLYERQGLPDVLFDVGADLPAGLYGGGRYIKKILKHLVDNALKFTREGGVYVRIYHDPQDYGINLCIDVQDTGIGMSRQELERVRNGTYQADSDRSRRAGGLGLGLPIVSGFVRAMHGFLRINSVPGEGTQVHLSIPQKVRDASGCMSIRHPERLKILFYQDPGKFKVPAVRDFYAQMILHVIRTFKLTLQRVSTQEDLEKMLDEQPFTHLFTADEEYSRAPSLYEEAAERMQVIVVARNDFTPVKDSRVTILKKPLSAFPLAEVLNAETAEEARAALSGEETVRFDGLKVLVVDDEEMNLIVAQGIFSDYGMEVHTAVSGSDAIARTRQEAFDVIFMDHMMPGMDGVEAMHRIRAVQEERNRSSWIIALTANAVSGAREMFFAEGFDGFVAKPIERVELERTLRFVTSKGTPGHHAKMKTQG